MLSHFLDSLFDYTQTHFRFEESLFEETNYPDTQQHKATHEKSIAQLQTLRQRYETGDVTPLSEMMVFLRRWLVNQIMGDDMNYVSYVK